MAAREPANSRPVHSRHAQLTDVTRRALERSPLYSEELGIVLAKRSDAAYFCWFLASLLFGARISEMTAKNTYRSFIHHGLTLSLIHISEPTRQAEISYAVFCLKK